MEPQIGQRVSYTMPDGTVRAADIATVSVLTGSLPREERHLLGLRLVTVPSDGNDWKETSSYGHAPGQWSW
jgi:hypothetical protein